MNYEDIQYMENNGDNIELDDDGNSRSDDGSEEGDSSDDAGYNAMLDAMVYSFCHVVDYFLKHIYKEPCMTLYITRGKWVNELLYGHEKRCFNMFRMNQCTFH